MIISSSDINLAASHQLAVHTNTTDVTNGILRGNQTGTFQSFQHYESDYFETSQESLLSSGESATYSQEALFEQSISQSISTYSTKSEEDTLTWNKIQSAMLLSLLEIFLGTRRDLLDKIRKQLGIDTSFSSEQASTWTSTGTHYSEVMQKESFTFQGSGTAITADGRTLSFQIDLEMSQEFMSQTTYELDSSGIMMTDPLVIWLDSNPDVISDQKFSFDLNHDGINESISSLNQGKGFLAYDKNEDGVINDGSELFGTVSGDGFKDLAYYDEDGNGFIDEADSIYSKLSVWVKNENGEDKLLNLKEADVGAIYLGHLATSLGINSSATNLPDAKIRSSGFYFHENGNIGMVQQIDFASAI